MNKLRQFFGDAQRDFCLTPEMIAELERVTGAGIGGLSRRLFAGDFRHLEIITTIRLALIGGGETPENAAGLIAAYVDPKPLTQGGYLAPAETSNEFIRDLVQVSPIRSVASVRTTTAPSVSYPKRTGITAAKWKGEGQSQEASEPTFGQAEIPVRELNTFVDISNQLLADSGGVAEQEVRLALADDFGQKEGLAFVSGDGQLAPEGLLTNADIPAFANGHATNLSADALIKLMYSLPATYRNAGTWGLNGTTLGVVRTLKDTNGNYIWQPGLQAGQPSTLLGRPALEVPDFPDVAANAFPIIFGDFAGYRVVDRLSMSILVNPYLLATNGLTRTLLENKMVEFTQNQQRPGNMMSKGRFI